MDDQNFDFKKSLEELEQINRWFQDEEVDLDEGLKKLRRGKDLIKKCRDRLKNVENEFIKIKEEFKEEVQEGEPVNKTNGTADKSDLPF
jgi:exodeoxyribonuclease VII small subunit